MNVGYSAEKIKVLEGLDAVRMRPGMYIGSTGARGLHHILWEIVDNAVDEAANGYADKVSVTINADGTLEVEDNGRGIPVNIHPQLGVSGVEVVFTKLHAGGKFDSDSYGYSGGLHGVGAAVVNALSEWLICEVYQDGNVYRQEFKSEFNPATKKIAAGKPQGPLEKTGNTRRRGSKVIFKPDARIFDDVDYNYDTVSRRLKELAFLNRGVSFTLTDMRVRAKDNRERTQEFKFDGGIVDFVKYANEDKNRLHPNPVYLQGQKDDVVVEAAFQYTDSYTENIFSYVNNIPTTEGGTHETGFKAAMTKVLGDFARKMGAIKEKDVNMTGEDFREGITAILLIKMKNIQFEGQTKTKLGNSEIRPIVEGLVTEKLNLFLEDIRNHDVILKILEKALQAAKARQAARKAKELSRKKNSLEGAPLVGKISSCIGKKAEENELFIVEGDSAGGSAKQGRDRHFQAILPLRGKPLNAEKKRLDEVLQNEEFRSIITALGTSIEADFDIRSLRYHKIIILSDADQDGAHIRAILLTFFYRYMRELITEGHVYIGKPPLYRLSKGNKIHYVYSDRELSKLTEEMGKGYSLQRYKGLGEMNPEQLWETTMDPERRTLIQVTIDDVAEAERMVTVLMGDKVEPRKQYISLHANFNREDKFAEMEGEVNHGKE